MRATDITELMTSASALLERFERRSDQVERQLKETRQQLQQLVQQLPTIIGHIAREQVQTSLQQPVQAFEGRLQVASQQLHQASGTLSQQLQNTQSLHRRLIWKMVAVALSSLALVVIGGGWLSTHYYNEIRRNQISAELLKAYNTADVTLCGKRLCAYVETEGSGHGEQGRYRVVRDRRR